MVFNPLTTLLLAGIREVLVINTPRDQEAFLEGRPSALVLGDNLFYGQSLAARLQAQSPDDGGHGVCPPRGQSAGLQSGHPEPLEGKEDERGAPRVGAPLKWAGRNSGGFTRNWRPEAILLDILPRKNS